MLWWTLQMLKSKNALTRREAVEKLGAMGQVRLAGTMAALLRDPDPGVRVAVVRGLAGLRSPVALRPLSEALTDSAPAVREAAVSGLSMVGDPRAVEMLETALRDGQAAVRQKALLALQSLGWQPQTEQQRALRAVAAGQFQRAAALGPAAIEPLSMVLQHGTVYERQSAVEALARIGDARTVRPLLAALSNEAPNVRTAAIEALGRTGDTRVVDPIIQTLQDPDRHARATAVDALGRLRDAKAVEPLFGALQDASWDVRAAAAQALGRLHDARAVEPLIGALADEDHDVRRNAVEALGQLADARAIEPLVLMLKDEQAAVRAVVPPALRRTDPDWEKSEPAKRALPRLKAALGDKEYWVRQAAAQAMQLIAAVRPAEQPLLGTFTEPEDYKRRAATAAFLEILGEEDRDLRQAAAEALGRLGDRGALEPLAQSLQDPDRWVGVAAARALVALHWQPPDEAQHLLQAQLLQEAAG